MRAHALGEYVVCPPGLAPTLATAGGANAATDLSTPAIDRTLFGNPLSCVIDANLLVSNTNTKTCTVTLRLQHCDTSGGSYTDFAASGGGYSPNNPTPPANAGPQTLVLSGTISAVASHLMAFYNLTGAKRFIKAVINSTFTASSADTANAAVSVMLGGINELLAAQPANA